MIQIKLDILLTMWKRGHNRQFSIIGTKSSYFKLTKEIDSLKPEVSDYDLRTRNQVPPIHFSNMVRVLWSFIVIEQKKNHWTRHFANTSGEISIKWYTEEHRYPDGMWPYETFFFVQSGSLHFTNFLPNDHKDVRLHTEESNDGC